jgi:hypothetical protein
MTQTHKNRAWINLISTINLVRQLKWPDRLEPKHIPTATLKVVHPWPQLTLVNSLSHLISRTHLILSLCPFPLPMTLSPHVPSSLFLSFRRWAVWTYCSACDCSWPSVVCCHLSFRWLLCFGTLVPLGTSEVKSRAKLSLCPYYLDIAANLWFIWLWPLCLFLMIVTVLLVNS